MKYIKQLSMLLALVSISFSQEKPDKNEQGDYFLMKITLQILEEDGTPLKDADVHVAVENFIEYQDGHNDFRGKSNVKGLFQIESKGQKATIIEVTKPGYYRSNLSYYPPYELNTNFISGNKVQPWNPTVPIMLKKICKPIPMVVRLRHGVGKSYGTAPAIGENLKWDLILADWLPPYGKGKQADIVARFESNYADHSNFSVKLSVEFENENDGMIPINSIKGQESLLKFPRIAPDNGYDLKTYQSMIELRDGMSTNKEPDMLPAGYFIRFRTKVDQNGNIISAQYGKITTPISLIPPDRILKFPQFAFSSYLNPTPNDRNLEYDQQNNLAPEADKGVTLAP